MRAKKKGTAEDKWLDSITNSMDLNLSKLQEIAKKRGAWRSSVHKVIKSKTQLSY